MEHQNNNNIRQYIVKTLGLENIILNLTINKELDDLRLINNNVDNTLDNAAKDGDDNRLEQVKNLIKEYNNEMENGDDNRHEQVKDLMKEYNDEIDFLTTTFKSYYKRGIEKAICISIIRDNHSKWEAHINRKYINFQWLVN